MISAIEKEYPQDAVLSEERGGSFSDSGRTWLLDPVDGTANFSRANPMFCSCVAVMEDGVVTHAAVAAPRLGDLYHASLGGGAFSGDWWRDFPVASLGDDGDRIRLRRCRRHVYRAGQQPLQGRHSGDIRRVLADAVTGQRGRAGSLDSSRIPGYLHRDPQHSLGLRSNGASGERSWWPGHRPLRRTLDSRLRRPHSFQYTATRRGASDPQPLGSKVRVRYFALR